ncbi:MAG: hypothetical protein FWE05_03150 [Defluviitaleaceae bacterium]|nr:hypothetical protein [Defluviitaleaceae bacterium]
MYPIAEQFKNGTLTKPIYKKTEFFQGGFFAIQERFKKSMSSFPSAYQEFQNRTSAMEDNTRILQTMWDYIKIV